MTDGHRSRRAAVPWRLLIATLVVELSIVAALLVTHPWRAGVQARAVAVRTPVATTDRFDAERAMELVRLQLAAGPRPAGSAALAQVGDRLRALLPGGHFEVVPSSGAVHPLRNIVGELPGVGRAIVLGAHYDTQPYPPGFVGANDAAAAVATVIEVASELRREGRPEGAPPVRFVLFDGEESPIEDDTDFYAHGLRGSKVYAAAHGSALRAMVLLDYVGNRRVQLPREASSDPELWRRVRDAASRVGTKRVFPPTTEASILDDHTPFLRAGVPAVDLIDWSYRPFDDDRDRYHRLSVSSVDAVGETMVELLRSWH
ncbi:MAG TPA: M28 family peptidase [Baekduia sp.]|nr:M28 family peptidase [Baekduia sp.]